MRRYKSVRLKKSKQNKINISRRRAGIFTSSNPTVLTMEEFLERREAEILAHAQGAGVVVV